MRILFTTGHAYFPQRGGGAQSNTDQLVKGLIACGHAVAVACTLSGGGWTEKRSRVVRTITGAVFSRDMFDGYPVYRAWDPTNLDEVIWKFRPDVAVVQNGSTVPMARSLKTSGIPTIVYFHNVEFDDLLGDPADVKGITYISNSEFTAKRVKSTFGLTSVVIRPYVPAFLYQTKTSRQNVTFVNPYPEKGADIAFDIAERCPDIPFVFVESWGIDTALRIAIDQRMSNLPNVTLRLRTTEMKAIYSKARILLAPSRWEEAWGRVATEAQFSGIPVVGSRQGGLPEAIGPGGVTIDIEAGVSIWVAAIRRLWDDEREYQRLSNASLEFSQRSEMQPASQLSKLIEVMNTAIGLDK